MFALHLDAAIVDVAVAVKMGNCHHCYDRLRMDFAIVEQSVAAQIEHHAVHLIEWQMALVKFERSLVAEVIVAKLMKIFNHFIWIASV